MRLVGATQAYVKGPFVVEGMIQGGLGGLVVRRSALVGAVRCADPRPRRRSEILGRAAIVLPPRLVPRCSSLGGMAVGVVGSLVSLRPRYEV